MKLFSKCYLIVTLVLLSVIARAQGLPQEQFLIYNAQIVDVLTGKIKSERAVLVKGDQIKALGDFDQLSKGVPKSQQLDAKNKFIIPGLWDMHIHLEGQGLEEDNQALLPLFIAFGITTVRDCASDLGETVLQWRDEINEGELFGPNLFTAGLKLEGKNSSWKGDLEIENETELALMMDKQDVWAPDFIKITDNKLHGELFLKSIQAAHDRGYVVSGHVPIDLTLEEMVDAGFSSVEHASYLNRLGYDQEGIVAQLRAGTLTSAQASALYRGEFDQQKADRNYKILGDKGLFVTPTYIGARQMSYSDQENHLLDSMMTTYLTKAYTAEYLKRLERVKNETPEQMNERKRNYQFNISQLLHYQDAGITILAGSDGAVLNALVYPAQSLIQELQIFQDAGLKPIDVLRAATINGARFLKKDPEMGSIDVGKRADLVILDSNPLENINATTHISGVFTKSSYLGRADLDKILSDARETKIRLDKSREN
ncbi:amidohydrolase family protein [Algoriphagus terrigena]|uniref:amidohydrolase family protein n=1 Tax=Algoriphagus terrigena TaxID=344884 RepID=UPI000687C106|nr:amidohydrolase family protein [Algoriphagus terrigena]